MIENKVLEGEVITEEELIRSRAQRDAFDFLCSPAGIDFLSKAFLDMLYSRRRE